MKEGRVSACPDPLDALQLLDGMKKNGLVEVVEATTSLDDIGGLGLLKDWLMRRASAFSESAKAYGVPAPEGLLIVGIPGTGKSLTAKATAGAFGLPLLRLDMGCEFGGIVGQSEANLRSVIQTAEANRRSQRGSYNWTTFEEAWERWKIPPPQIFEQPWPQTRQSHPQPVRNVQPLRVQS